MQRAPTSFIVQITGLLLAMLVGTSAGAQGTPSGDLALIEFARAPLGAVPPVLDVVNGTLAIVDHDGQRMLKASSRAMLLLRLPSVLPADFTLEIDLVPKTCCQPEDIAIEGTATINQGNFSANLLWKREAIMVVGGGTTFDRPMPEDVAVTLPGVLTNIVYTFRGEEVTVYTNGRLIYTLPNRKFVRGRVLRIFLGGQNDTDQAVYLARFRVAPGVLVPGAVAATAAPLTGGNATVPNAPITVVSANPPRATATGVPAPMPSSPATTTGPLTPGQTGPLTAGQTSVISPSAAPPPPPLPARSLSLPGFSAVGGFFMLPPRAVAIGGFTASGLFSALTPRTLGMPGFSASGLFAALAPRQLAVPGFAATGMYGRLAPRSIGVPGFSATGVFATLSPRTIVVSGFTASGFTPMLAPRSLALPGFSATGLFTVLSPRTVTLQGWTATGVFPP